MENPTDVVCRISRLGTRLESRFLVLYDANLKISALGKRSLDKNVCDGEFVRNAVRNWCHGFSLQANLRSFLTSSDAQFKSGHQEMAVIHSVTPTEDALIILPTGAGKSLVFMLSADIHKEKVVIVVVLLMALQQYLIKRWNDAGIPASRWNAKGVAGTRIVVVSAEHLSCAKCVSFIRKLPVINKLHPFFADEAHLILLWQSFGETLRYVHKFIRPDSVQFPVIALTGTARLP